VGEQVDEWTNSFCTFQFSQNHKKNWVDCTRAGSWTAKAKTQILQKSISFHTSVKGETGPLFFIITFEFDIFDLIGIGDQNLFVVWHVGHVELFLCGQNRG
jgi:hypothetical protein